MKAEVLAQSFNPETGIPTANPRIEVIDLKTNRLFDECVTLTDVAEVYMRYWNRLGRPPQKEMVLVQSVSWLKETE